MDVFRPIRPQRTFEQAVAQIGEAITNGTLKPGDALPGERALAARMDVSRRTIREAAKVLAEAGVVEVVSGPGGGTFVRTDLVPADLTAHVEMHATEISDVLEARRLIEPRIAQLAGIYAEREDFEELAQIVSLQQEHAGDRERYLALESRFHMTVARVARNTFMYETMRALSQRVMIAADIAFRGGLEGAEASLEIHQRTLDALRTRDPEVIDDVMDDHLALLERAWERQGGRLRFKTFSTFLVHESSRTVG